jgi:hypothetical protein
MLAPGTLGSMPIEYEGERCPICGSPATVKYKRRRDSMNEIVGESRRDIRCSSALCPGEDAKPAPVGVVGEVTEGE